jgi:hypothetical protein
VLGWYFAALRRSKGRNGYKAFKAAFTDRIDAGEIHALCRFPDETISHRFNHLAELFVRPVSYFADMVFGVSFCERG